MAVFRNLGVLGRGGMLSLLFPCLFKLYVGRDDRKRGTDSFIKTALFAPSQLRVLGCKTVYARAFVRGCRGGGRILPCKRLSCQEEKPSFLFTALIGALSNVLLNLFLIPTLGALGAAIATLASYLLVMIVRLVDAPRIIPFRLSLVRLTLSLVLLMGAAAVMTLELEGMYLWTSLLSGVILLINLPALLRGVRAILLKK